MEKPWANKEFLIGNAICAFWAVIWNNGSYIKLLPRTRSWLRSNNVFPIDRKVVGPIYLL